MPGGRRRRPDAGRTAVIWAVLVAALTGYLLGRLRLWGRFADWAEDQVRFEVARWKGRIPLAFLLGCFAVTHPVRTAKAWRYRDLED